MAKTITCPKCKGSLEQVVYANIEVDRCCQCGGIWFDALEAEELKKIEGSESLDIGNPAVGSQLNHIDGKILCPRCHAATIRMLDIDRYSIWYEQCPKCQGIWLDAGEFKQFKQNFQGDNFLKRAKNAFRFKP